MIVIGTITYHELEGWSSFESLYFSVTTMATVGFGDVHPVTYAGKFFTIFYVIFGVSAALYAFTLLAESYFEHTEERIQEKMDKYNSMKEKRLEAIEGEIQIEKTQLQKIRDRLRINKEDFLK